MKKIEVELERVRNLKENSSYWFKDERPLNIIWEDDPLSTIPGISPTKIKKLNQVGITKLSHLKNKIGEELINLHSKLTGISMKKLQELKNTSCNVGKCPYRMINYTSFQNLANAIGEKK